MTRVLLPLLVAAATFLEQEIPGLRVDQADPLSGKVSGNFRRMDLDGDGAIDLVLPTYAAFQRNEAYHRDDQVPVPYNVSGSPGDAATTRVKAPGQYLVAS